MFIIVHHAQNISWCTLSLSQKCTLLLYIPMMIPYHIGKVKDLQNRPR